MTGRRLAWPTNVGWIALLVVVLGLMANVTYNIVMAHLGASYPYTLFLFSPEDRWGDFFKLAFSFPGAPISQPVTTWSVQPHIDFLKGLADRYTGPLNADHMPPLPTLLMVLARRSMEFVDPIVLFIVVMISGLSTLAITIAHYAPKPDGALRWAMVCILSYPVIVMADRGHVFSLICAITLIAGTLRVLANNRFDATAFILFAVAINMRPNVALVPLLIVLAGRTGRLKDLVFLGITGAAVLMLIMSAATALYPHYGWETWVAGLQDYRHNYVEQPQSFGFQTSLPMVGEILGLPIGPVSFLCLTMGAVLGSLTIALRRQGRLSDGGLVFLAVALMPLITPALADYHLIPFLLPPLLIARDGGPKGAKDWVVLCASLAILIPKNYVYGNDNLYTAWSYQIILNPVILLIAVWLVIITSWHEGLLSKRVPKGNRVSVSPSSV